jgi:hypothetical protein
MLIVENLMDIDAFPWQGHRACWPESHPVLQRLRLPHGRRPPLLLAGQRSSHPASPARAARLRRCPSDGSDTEFEFDYDPDDGIPTDGWARINVPAEYFSCSTCHLVLDDYALIEQAKLPDSFDFIDTDPEWPEPDYGND